MRQPVYRLSDVQKILDHIILGSDLLHSRVGISPAVPGVLLTVLTTIPTALEKVFLSRLLIGTYMRTNKCRHLNPRSETQILLYLKIIVEEIFQGPRSGT